MNETHGHHGTDAPDASGARCRLCGRSLGTCEVRELRDRAFDLGIYLALTFDEMLCRECFAASARRAGALSSSRVSGSYLI